MDGSDPDETLLFAKMGGFINFFLWNSLTIKIAFFCFDF